MTRDELCPKNKCTGCGLCSSVCPSSSIQMCEDMEGFLFPMIDSTKCINCGLCRRNCPSINPIYKNNNSEVYAAQLSDCVALKKSASGGAAYIIAKKFIQNGGLVVGCIFDENLIARHVIVDTIEKLALLQGTKYVQSNTVMIYDELSRLIKLGENVLFIGTPCQVAAAKKIVSNSNQLLTIDLVCHGVSSPKLFQKYIEWLESSVPKEKRQYLFRDKTMNGWGTTCSYTVKTKGHIAIKYRRSDRDPYYSDFLEGKNYRECCYKCIYADHNRVGDFTVGDFWGISREHPEFSNTRRGVSVLLINSSNGKEFFSKIENDLVLIPSTMEKASNSNGNLSHPARRPECRDTYYKILDNPYEAYVRKFYFSPSYVMASMKDLSHKIPGRK